jgi:hypothetical protein
MVFSFAIAAEPRQPVSAAAASRRDAATIHAVWRNLLLKLSRIFFAEVRISSPPRCNPANRREF